MTNNKKLKERSLTSKKQKEKLKHQFHCTKKQMLFNFLLHFLPFFLFFFYCCIIKKTKDILKKKQDVKCVDGTKVKKVLVLLLLLLIE